MFPTLKTLIPIAVIMMIPATNLPAADGQAPGKFKLHMSERLLQAAFDLDTFTETPSNLYFAGANVSTISQSSTTANAFLIENDEGASFYLHYSGAVSTNANGQSFPARRIQVDTDVSFYSQFSGNQPLTINAYGIRTTPVNLGVSTSGQVNNIATSAGGLPIFRLFRQRIASNRAAAEIYRSLPQWCANTRALVYEQAVREINGGMDKAVRDAWTSLNQNFIEPLLVAGFTRQDLRLFTTKKSIVVDINGSELPLMSTAAAENSDFHIVSDHSFFQTVAAAKLSGKTLSESELYKMFSFGGGKSSDEVENSLQITFPKANPLTINTEHNGLTVTMRPHKFNRDGDDYPPLNIRTKYLVETTDHGVQLKRTGDILIYPPRFEGNEQATDLTSNERILKMILKKKLSKKLAEIIPVSSVTLPINLKRQNYLSVRGLILEPGLVEMTGSIIKIVRN
jgi:hypothetical protein